MEHDGGCVAMLVQWVSWAPELCNRSYLDDPAKVINRLSETGLTNHLNSIAPFGNWENFKVSVEVDRNLVFVGVLWKGC